MAAGAGAVVHGVLGGEHVAVHEPELEDPEDDQEEDRGHDGELDERGPVVVAPAARG